ncbi:MAG: hypothetical protein NT061_00365 [Spirochaetes bacterium]|nr:hypothetical protein [Spirochaetota bacterium]
MKQLSCNGIKIKFREKDENPSPGIERRGMDTKMRGEKKSFRQKRILIGIFITVAFIAIAGFALIQFQERDRIHLVAEYQAYPFASLLLGASDYRVVKG